MVKTASEVAGKWADHYCDFAGEPGKSDVSQCARKVAKEYREEV